MRVRRTKFFKQFPHNSRQLNNGGQRLTCSKGGGGGGGGGCRHNLERVPRTAHTNKHLRPLYVVGWATTQHFYWLHQVYVLVHVRRCPGSHHALSDMLLRAGKLYVQQREPIA